MSAITSLNLNGIRAATRKGWLQWLASRKADIVCVQELKAREDDLSEAMRRPDGLTGYFHCAEKKGYSGVAIYARRPADNVVYGFGDEEFDAEGRYIQADFGRLTVVSLYLPSGSSSPQRLQAKFRCMEAIFPHFAKLADSGRDVVICGDWNIAHTEMDIKNWRANRKNSGFLPEERAWLSTLFEQQGWCDVYRRLYPEAQGEGYTWWSNRGQAWSNNVGWRIDYHIATAALAGRALSADIYKTERFSDHAPLSIDYADHAP